MKTEYMTSTKESMSRIRKLSQFISSESTKPKTKRVPEMKITDLKLRAPDGMGLFGLMMASLSLS
jgi:hypothetical protein